MGTAISIVAHQILSSPITSIVISVIVWIWVQIFLSSSDGKSYAAGYNECVQRQQWWRTISAPCVHTSFIQLLLNVITLWSCRFLEQKYGSWFYFRYTLVLAIAESLLSVGAIHALFKISQQQRRDLNPQSHALANATWHGSAGVILAWLAYQSVSVSITIEYPFYFLGVFPIPWTFAPLVFMFTTPLFNFRQQVGGTNAAGLFCGYFLALGVLAILPDIYWSVCFILNVCVFLISKGLARNDSMNASGQSTSTSRTGGDSEVIELPATAFNTSTVLQAPTSTSTSTSTLQVPHGDIEMGMLGLGGHPPNTATSTGIAGVDDVDGQGGVGTTPTSSIQSRIWSSARNLTNSLGGATAAAAAAAATGARGTSPRGAYAPVASSVPADDEDGEEGEFESARPSLRSRSLSPGRDDRRNSSNQLNALL
jgi:membrane associated rhomboid family serine protease